MKDMNELRSALGISLALMLAIGVACSPPPRPGEEPAEFETVDVEPAENLEIDLSGDRKAAPRAKGAGQLPGNFPPGLPVFKSSTIADIGEGAIGSYVQFRARAGEDEVKSWYRTELGKAGWSFETAPGGVFLATKGDRRARITIERPGPVTVVLVEY